MFRLCRYFFQILTAVVSLLMALGWFRYADRIKLYEELESRVMQRWYGYRTDSTVRRLLTRFGVDPTKSSQIVRVYAECHMKLGDTCFDLNQASVLAIDNNDNQTRIGSLAQVQQWAFEKPNGVYWWVFLLSVLAILCTIVHDKNSIIRSECSN